MAARFPQSASSLGWRIKPAYASKVKAICWPAGANSLHVLRAGDTATTVITRTAGSAGFNATDGLITGNVNGASTATYFAVTTLSAFSLTEAGPLHYGMSYYGDIFGGFASDMHAIGAGTPLDSFAGTMQIFGSGYVWYYRVAGGAGGTNAFGGSDNVAAFMSVIWQTDSTDATSRNRLWLNGAEVTGARSATAPTTSSAVGTSGNPLYLGGTMDGSGNTNAHGEAWWVGVGLTDAEAAAITADPSSVIEVAPDGPVITGPTGQSVTAPAAATFTASVSGTYTGLRWQRQAAGAGAWSDISGATSTSYTTGATTVSGGTANNTDRYRLQVDWSGGTVTSTDVALTVAAGGTAPAITVQPSNQSVTVGSTATFSVTATGSGTKTYQWERQPAAGGGYSAISGATSSSYTTPVTTISGGSANLGDTYRCVVTGDTSPPATSSAATLTVLYPVATTVSVTLTTDGSTPAASLTNLKWAFYDQATPDLFTAAPVAKGAVETTDGSGVFSASITGTALRQNDIGYLIVTNSDGTVTQGAALKAFAAPVAVS